MLQETAATTLLVTIFVVQMMVLIEGLHEHAGARVHRFFGVGGFRKYLLAAALGALPGCLGPLTVSAIYSHGLISFGGIVACMVAAMGDEAFVLLALAPQRAWWVFGTLFVLGVAAGLLTDALTKMTGWRPAHACRTLDVPCADSAHSASHAAAASRRSWDRRRIVLVLLFFAFGVLFGAGIVHADEGLWVRIMLVAVSMIATLVVAASSDHFLQSHILHHILRNHAPKILLWTLGAILFLEWAGSSVNLEPVVAWGKWPVLLAACLVGLLPESGPHVIFVTLYAQGAVPLSVLLASSIVQDGHGMLPLLAESRRSFLQIKTVNFVFGLLVGGALLLLGH